MTQTKLDLRTAVAARRDRIVGGDNGAPRTPMFTGQGPAPETRPVRREFMASEKQIAMIKDMLAERYPAELAAEMFAAIDWKKINTRDKFRTIFQGLKDTPRLPKGPTPESVPVPDAGLMEGTFTVEFQDGTYKTLRVRRQADDATFRPGQLLLAYLSGSDNTTSYTNFGEVTVSGQPKIWYKHRQNAELAEAVKVLTGDQIACAKAYARLSRRCSFCKKELTTPESLDAGWGEKCAKDRGLPWG